MMIATQAQETSKAGSGNLKLRKGISVSRQFLIVSGFSLVMRLLFVFFMPCYHYAGGLDSYESLGCNILQGHGLVVPGYGPTAYRTPLYPLFIAGIYRVFGQHPQAVWTFQCLLSALTAGLVCVLARKYVSPKLGLFAGLIAAVHLPFIRYSGLLLSETLFTFLLVTALTMIAPNLKDRSPRWVLTAGLCFGLASLTRPVVFLFPFGLLLWEFLGWLVDRGTIKFKVFLKLSAIFLVSFLLVLAPWTIRNWQAFGTPIATTTQGGMSLWLGLHPDPRGFGLGGGAWFDKFSEQAGVRGEIETDRFFRKEGMREIKQDPSRFCRLGLVKIGWLFYPFDGDFYGLSTRYNLPSGLVISFAIFGLILCGWKRYAKLLTYSVFYFIFFTVLMYGMPRFRLPLDPVLIVLAVAGLDLVNQKPLKIKHLWAICMLMAVLLNIGFTLSADSMRMRIKGFLESSMRYSTFFKG